MFSVRGLVDTDARGRQRRVQRLAGLDREALHLALHRLTGVVVV